MTRFFIAATEAAAQAIVDAIDAREAQLAAPSGRADAQGDIIGVNAATGRLDPAAAKTTTWTIPAQRLDGAWCVIHPENSPASAEHVAYVTQDLSTETLATDPDDGSWFALPTRGGA